MVRDRLGDSGLLASDLPDDPLLVQDLLLYFPHELRKSFPAAVGRHRLRREIIATYACNTLVNRTGPSFITALQERTGAKAADIWVVPAGATFDDAGTQAF